MTDTDGMTYEESTSDLKGLDPLEIALDELGVSKAERREHARLVAMAIGKSLKAKSLKAKSSKPKTSAPKTVAGKATIIEEIAELKRQAGEQRKEIERLKAKLANPEP